MPSEFTMSSVFCTFYSDRVGPNRTNCYEGAAVEPAVTVHRTVTSDRGRGSEAYNRAMWIAVLLWGREPAGMYAQFAAALVALIVYGALGIQRVRFQLFAALL